MKSIRIGINGFGRIGKVFFRLLIDHPEIDLVGINDTMDDQTLLYLLRFDTVHGRLNHDLKLENGKLYIDGKGINVGHFANPTQIPWKEWGADIVLDSSGRFTTKADLAKHIAAGAKKVILSNPPDDKLDNVVILGVNDDTLNAQQQIISNASCTANSVAPILHLLNKEFGIVTAFLNTVHPYTNNQRIIDSPHADFRRSRASAANIIPTSTSAIKAIHTVMPELADRFHGISTRVPIISGALSELVITFEKPVTVESINAAVERYANSSLKGIVDYCTDPVVSSDIVGSPFSSIFDSLATKVVNGTTAQLITWYDNESGYSNRLVDLVIRLDELGY